MTNRLLTLRDRLELVEARIDAARRKCTTGYGCGSTCISLRKECRSQGGPGSRERIQRLEQLSRGEVKPRGLGTPKPAEAAAMAEGLRSARGSKAQELLGQRKATREAKAAEEAAKAKEATAGRAPGARKGTPRGEAETVEGSGDYEFARKSAIQNAGEDIALSARHKRNMFRSIEEAEASGQVEKILTRDNLLKNFPSDLVSGVAPENVFGRLEAHYCLKAFPNLSAKEVASYAAAAEARRLRGETTRGAGSALARDYEESDAKTVRKQYFEAFQKVRQFVEDNKDIEPGALRERLRREVHTMINALRKTQGSGYSATHKDPHNPVANAMIDLYNRLRTGGKATVYGQLNEFTKALSATGKFDKANARGTLENAMEPAIRIMEGASLNEAFGQQGANGKWRFSAADRYVGQARREGGRKVGGTPQAATDTIVKGLGFRGLQYGNSVTDDERKHHVQKAAEALVDLADALGLPDKAIGLNGTLGLAIGARGRGGAAAHYEPDLKVINLTRKNGVGSLSHEWGHALDNYAAGGGTAGRRGAAFLTEHVGSPEKRAAMGNVIQAWTTSGYVRQCYDTIRAIKKAGGMISEDYWLSHVELFARSFEAHVSLKLAKAGRSNTYLTRKLHEAGMNKDNADPRTGDGLWPSRQQAEAMEPMFDALIARLRQDDFPGPTNRNDSRDERIWRFMHAMAVA